MSTALDVSLKVLYVQGLAVDVDRTTTDQLRKASAELQITTIAGSAAALAELRRTPGWQALFASPSLPQNEVLALIASLRRDRIPIAIVPILDDVHQDLFASAVATGADDVLVRRNGALVNINETLTRIRQSPHLFPAEQRRRISVLYAGRDPLVWNLLDQVPFVKADRVATGVDGTCSVRRPGAGDDSLRADAVIIDETPGDAHPLQVLKSVKAQASDLPVIMLTSAGAADIATAALELGADDTVLKTGIFRRRLIATLRRVHQRIELNAQQHETRTREERLRQIVENVPTGIMVVAGDGRVLAMNAAALHLFSAARPRDIVGRDFRDMVGLPDRDAITDLIHKVTRGEPGGATFEARTLAGDQVQARVDAVVLERDARGGRGIVASITRAEQPAVGTDSDAQASAAAELATLRDTLQKLERHYAELEDARTQEHAAWESERQRLEARLEEAERLAAERQTIAERLDDVTAELARTSESFTTERQALERRLQELEVAARDAAAAGTAHTELERALDAVREEQRQAIEAHALERSGWQEIRAELETRVHQLDSLHQSEHDTLVASLQQDVQRLEQALAEERDRWQTTRAQLEGELRNAREALWAEHTERDAMRATLEAALEAARAAAEADRMGWEQARKQIESERDEARAAASARDAERDQTQADLEQERQALQSAIDAERGDWNATRVTLEDDRRQLEAVLQHERAEWTERRLALEEERRHLLDSGVQQSDLAAERSRLESELDAARQQSSAERSAWEQERHTTRERLEHTEAALRTATDDYDTTRAHLQQERDDAQHALAQLRADLQQQIAHLEADIVATRERADEVARERDGIQHRWQAEQAALEQARADERAEWQQKLGALDAALSRATEAVSQQDAGWQQERSSLLQAAADARTYAEQERGHLVSLHARELEEWRQAVDEARGERDQAAARLASFEAELNQAHRQLVELDYVRAALEIAQVDQTQSSQRLAILDSELQETRRQLNDIDGLRTALDAARAERDHAQQRVVALETDLHDARQHVSSLQAEAENARQRADTLDADLHTTRQHLNELEQLRPALDAARAERDHARHRVVALETERHDAQQHADSLQAELEDARQRTGTLNAELDSARQRADTLDTELHTIRQHLADLEQLQPALDVAHAEHDHIRQRVVALETERHDAQQHASSLQTELDNARQHAGSLDAELQDARQRADTLDAELHSTRQQLAELEQLRPALDAARAEHAQVQLLVDALSTDLASAQALASDRQTLVDALDAARNEIRHTDAAHHTEREEWHRNRLALERELRELDARHRHEQDSWNQTRSHLEAEVHEASRLTREQQYLTNTITALQADCSALAGTLADERSGNDHLRRELEELRSALAGSQSHLSEMDAALDRAAQSADEQFKQHRDRHDARDHALAEQVAQLSARLVQETGDAERAQAALRADYTRAAEGHARLIDSDAFGYAVTTMKGELVRCNEAFARMFGYATAADAQSRSAGRPVPGLGRHDIVARLASDGRVDRVTSCVERIDGKAIRIIDSALVLPGGPNDGPAIVEHLVVAGPAGPTPQDIQSRRLQEVGALTHAMMPELESLSTTVQQRSAALSRPTSPDAEQLRAASAEVATLVRQLSAFSRRQLRGPEPLDLGDTVRHAEPMLTRLVGDYIGFATDLGPTTAVNAQPEDLDQLLTSLVTLGRDLLPAGGAMTVQVRQEDADDASGSAMGVPGPVVSVKSTGYGVQFPGAVTALELVAGRCGGTVQIRGEAGRLVQLDVVFPRCGMPIL